MKTKILVALAATLALTACTTTNPYTGERQTSKAAWGAGLGAVAGAAVGYSKGSKNRNQNMLKGAAIGGVAGGGVGAYMDYQEKKLRDRLQGTASGNGHASPSTGYGVVQPVEALQRPLESMGAGSQRSADVPRGQVPPARADLLADTRHDAVWWGLAGGGALVVLLVLRPVLARRRR